MAIFRIEEWVEVARHLDARQIGGGRPFGPQPALLRGRGIGVVALGLGEAAVGSGTGFDGVGDHEPLRHRGVLVARAAGFERKEAWRVDREVLKRGDPADRGRGPPAEVAAS